MNAFYLRVYMAFILMLTGESSFAGENDVFRVSMISLIASPVSYDGKNVVVQGYLYGGGEEFSLYLGKEYMDLGIIENSIPLVFAGEGVDLSIINKRPVIIEGWFLVEREFPHAAVIDVISIRQKAYRFKHEFKKYQGAAQADSRTGTLKR